ncbi:alanine racemase [Microbacterium sp. CIAB417]|uniref:alanine racemase n=1 Tax=Microbacterium sp. CIAB417 TaxID=2860287 RepID=UPI001FAB7734|nr:alanine racemase [Microbacterium sp. CIAB417]
MPHAPQPSDGTAGLPGAELRVHEDAIRANARYFARLTRGRLMAVLKADAFGHGPVASTVVEEGATSLGVASIDEALALRRGGAAVPILSWLNAIDADFASAVSELIDLGVASVEALHAITRAAHRLGGRARVHLHVDLGMSRDGAPASEWWSLCEPARVAEHDGHVQVIGVMGHMSCADRSEDPQNTRERLLFMAAVRSARHRGLAPAVTHLAATAATITGAGGDHDLHRIGAGLYGIDPSQTGRGVVLNEVNTTPGLTEHSQVPRMFAAVGLGYTALIDQLLDAAVAR